MDRRVLAVAAAVTGALVVGSTGYGPHRDELYFVQAGRHLAWGYPDQPPLTPLLARLADDLAPDSLLVLRLPSALAAGALVLLTAMLARELGGGRSAQLLAASCTAVGGVFLAVGHLLSTTTFDLLAWTSLLLLLVKVLCGGDRRLWLAAGAVAGVGLLNKQLIGFLLVAVLVGLLAAGPRGVLRTRWPWAGAALALALWSPHLLWQAQAGWPALEVASSVASGGSTSSEPRALLLPLQLVLVSPFLVPVWAAGLVRLWRDPRLRSLAVVYPVLAAVFLVTGGKPYYLAGLYPLLLAAGAGPTVQWLARGPRRTPALAAGLALSAVVSTVVALPVLPPRQLGPVLALNGEPAEALGWPELVAAVAQAAGTVPGDVVVLTRNYGQAGAVDRFGGAYGLGPAYSGHNGYADWGPPPERALPVVAVGLRREELDRWFARCRLVGRVDNGLGLDNAEQGAPLHVCHDRRRSWDRTWPQVRRLA